MQSIVFVEVAVVVVPKITVGEAIDIAVDEYDFERWEAYLIVVDYLREHHPDAFN